MSFNPKDHMIDLKGKDYLPVAWRIVWFREDHPNGAIRTECVSQTPPLFRATVLDEDGRFLSDGHASATLPAGGRAVWSGREFEKAETAAIGRALAHAGYGTQFDAEDEGDYLADSPVDPSTRKPAPYMKDETSDRPANGKLAPMIYDRRAATEALLTHYGKRFTRRVIETALDKIDATDQTTEQMIEAFKRNVAEADAKRMAEELGGELHDPKA